MKPSLLAPAALWLAAAGAPGQDPAAAVPSGGAAAQATVSFWEIIERGGVMMYPLAGLSFIAISLILLYFLTIRQGVVVSRRFMAQADALIRKQDYAGLLGVCKRTGECVARVTQKALEFATKNPTASFDEVREVTLAEGTRQASILTQRITYLADVGAIAPMVGLLGTVLGMIKSFNEIAQDTFIGAGQIQLAGGVSEALITTAAGLVIGIPSLIFYSVFRGRVQRLIAEMEAACTHLMALLAAQYKRATARAGARSAAAAEQARRAREAQFALGQEKLDPHGI
jgi:biopolymer transport protein ExbB